MCVLRLRSSQEIHFRRSGTFRFNKSDAIIVHKSLKYGLHNLYDNFKFANFHSYIYTELTNYIPLAQHYFVEYFC
jgi:hypothetical protein